MCDLLRNPFVLESCPIAFGSGSIVMIKSPGDKEQACQTTLGKCSVDFGPREHDKGFYSINIWLAKPILAQDFK